jgi:hypothetical protein
MLMFDAPSANPVIDKGTGVLEAVARLPSVLKVSVPGAERIEVWVPAVPPARSSPGIVTSYVQVFGVELFVRETVRVWLFPSESTVGTVTLSWSVEAAAVPAAFRFAVNETPVVA